MSEAQVHLHELRESKPEVRWWWWSMLATSSSRKALRAFGEASPPWPQHPNGKRELEPHCSMVSKTAEQLPQSIMTAEKATIT